MAKDALYSCPSFLLYVSPIKQAQHVLNRLGTYCAFSFLYHNIGMIIQSDTCCLDIFFVNIVSQ